MKTVTSDTNCQIFMSIFKWILYNFSSTPSVGFVGGSLENRSNWSGDNILKLPVSNLRQNSIHVSDVTCYFSGFWNKSAIMFKRINAQSSYNCHIR
jgi:hypothetical protein